MTGIEEYRRKMLSLSEAVGLLQSGQTLCTAMAAAEPVGLLAELEHHVERLEQVEVWMCLPMARYGFYTRPEMVGRFQVDNWFYGAGDRDAHPLGLVSYIPNNLHQAATGRLHARGGPDVFWGTATPPDERGFLSLSTGLIYERSMLDRARLVILEINERRPWTLGDTQVHVSEVHHFVEHHVPLPQLPAIAPSAVEETIGRYVADLIADGSTLQLGIGGIPNAIAGFLHDKKDLGIHTEMFTDGMVDLYESGAVTGRKKSLWPGKMVGAFALGTDKLYRFVDRNLAVEFQQGKITNDPYVIGRNSSMISVNTALQVDLIGQVCSQSIGSRHFSGTGGQLDTHRGAQRSPGGRGIIALRSTARAGSISTIVAQMAAGTEITVPGQDVDTIVTEYGVAELRGRSMRERAEALLRIAHPDHRERLREQAEQLQILPRRTRPATVLPAGQEAAPPVTAA